RDRLVGEPLVGDGAHHGVAGRAVSLRPSGEQAGHGDDGSKSSREHVPFLDSGYVSLSPFGRILRTNRTEALPPSRREALAQVQEGNNSWPYGTGLGSC